MAKRKIQQGDIVPIEVAKNKIAICRVIFVSPKIHRIVQLGVCELIDKNVLKTYLKTKRPIHFKLFIFTDLSYFENGTFDFYPYEDEFEINKLYTLFTVGQYLYIGDSKIDENCKDRFIFPSMDVAFEGAVVNELREFFNIQEMKSACKRNIKSFNELMVNIESNKFDKFLKMHPIGKYEIETKPTKVKLHSIKELLIKGIFTDSKVPPAVASELRYALEDSLNDAELGDLIGGGCELGTAIFDILIETKNVKAIKLHLAKVLKEVGLDKDVRLEYVEKRLMR